MRNQAHEDIEYKAIRIGVADMERAVVNVLRFYDAKATLVFCATRDGVRQLHASLQKRGFDAVALSGELSQEERTYALQSLRDGRSRICVATDVAARGLDLPDLGLVVHADLPTNKETLTHRSGRTGRAGKKGICVLLVPHPKRRRAELLLASANIRAAWSGPPTAGEIRVLQGTLSVGCCRTEAEQQRRGQCRDKLGNCANVRRPGVAKRDLECAHAVT